jgi:hypothetical protein
MDLLCPNAQLRQLGLIDANGLEAVELRSEREVGDELRQRIPEIHARERRGAMLMHKTPTDTETEPKREVTKAVARNRSGRVLWPLQLWPPIHIFGRSVQKEDAGSNPKYPRAARGDTWYCTSAALASCSYLLSRGLTCRYTCGERSRAS